MDVNAPEVIGSFRILRKLGEGATGVVYLGERVEPFAQRVAIKVLRTEASLLAGQDALDHEEQVLTSLDHPGIVRLLDKAQSGPGGGYLVMDFVDGVPVDVFCLAARATEETRLKLILQIAEAVDYAHRQLVVHGDLKPGNVLVDERGAVRLLDFGVATLAGVSGSGMGAAHTPAYSSPEQRVGGRLTPAADIYALGVLAVELLAGLPLDRDLRAILSTATRPEAEERYRSMALFADDLRAWFTHLPVQARRTSKGYRLQKWARRNRTLAVVGAVLLLVLAGSVTGVVVQTARATHERRVTQARLRDLVQLTGTLEGELYDSLRPLPRGQQAAASLLQAATSSLDKVAAEDGADASLALEMGRQYGKLARLEEARNEKVQAADDVRKGLVLLRAVQRSDRNYAAAQAAAVELSQE